MQGLVHVPLRDITLNFLAPLLGNTLFRDHLRLPGLGLRQKLPRVEQVTPPLVSNLFFHIKASPVASFHGSRVRALVTVGGLVYLWVCPGLRWTEVGVPLWLATLSSMTSAAILMYEGDFFCSMVEIGSLR